MTAPDTTRLGRYQLVRKLATGGMAEVFLAKAMGPGGFEKTLVLKRILPTLAEDPQFVEMFLHEARLAAQLNHPNVVQIFDFGEVDGTYYLAMEFVDGPNLRSVLRKAPNKQISVTLAARIISQACEGLAYAHEFADPASGEPLQLIHRDVSADNLLLARNGAVKVVDFGVAKVGTQSSGSEAGTVKGKIAYMPPEQILGDFDLRSDVYALGVILYEMAAGTRPYDAMPDVQLITAIIKTEPRPLVSRVPHVPPEYARIVDKALQRDVSLRYQDCRELASDLEDFISNAGERVGTLQLAQLVTSVMGPGSGTGPVGVRVAGQDSGPTGIRLTTRSNITPATPWPAMKNDVPGTVRGGLSSLFDPPPAAPSPIGHQPFPSPTRSGSVPAFVPTPSPSTAVLKVKPAEPATPEARANVVLADAETMRTYDAGAPLATPQELEALRAELERDEGVNLFGRFPRHAGRLLQSNPVAEAVLTERIIGSVEGLLLCEAYGRLATTFEKLEAEAASDDTARWVFEVARAAFATPEQAQRLAQRLREGPPADAAGLARVLRFFGREYVASWMGVTESMDVLGSKEALQLGLIELARVSSEPFIARVLEDRPRRLAEYVYVLEKGRGADRQRAFRTLLARKDPSVSREVMTGLARAGSDDARNMLAATLGERNEAVRVVAVELLAQHFPAHVFKLVEPLLEPEGYQARSPSERITLWKAVGASTQPEALVAIAEVLKQKPSILTKGKVDALKLDALEGLAVMTGAPAQELLRTVAADRTQPGAVCAAAERHLTRGNITLEPPRAITESRRFERTPSGPREVLMELGALMLAARVLDVRHAAYETALQRLRARLDTILRKDRRAAFAVSGRQVTFNGFPVQVGENDAEMQKVCALFTRIGIGSFTFNGATVSVEELQQLVRWLAEGATVEGVVTPTIQRVHVTGAPDRPAKPTVATPPTTDPSKDAMVRAVDLVFALRRHLTEQKAQPSASLPEFRQPLHELAGLYQTRAVRFHGVTPAALDRDSVVFHHVNVVLLSLAFGAELGLPRQRLNDLAEFAFGNDVGMFDLPEETLTRVGELTAEDKRALLQARRTSGWFPFLRRGDAPSAVDWASVVVEHGLDWGAKDAAGVVTERTEIGLLGTIVSLAKLYDALTSKRAFRAALTPEQAIDTMANKVNHRFRPDLLPLFVRMVRRQGVRQLPRR